uniref:Uncharacterized protein n=1 Tax=Lepeophtheirus salmonis TaxID=72036 RepID=A0A0K2UJV1_LEPSM
MRGFLSLSLLILLGVLTVSGYPNQHQHKRRVAQRYTPTHPFGRIQQFHNGVVDFRRRRFSSRPRKNRFFGPAPLKNKPFDERRFRHPLSNFRSAPKKVIHVAKLPLNLRREIKEPSSLKTVPNFYYMKAEDIPGFSRFTLNDVIQPESSFATLN